MATAIILLLIASLVINGVVIPLYVIQRSKPRLTFYDFRDCGPEEPQTKESLTKAKLYYQEKYKENF